MCETATAGTSTATYCKKKNWTGRNWIWVKHKNVIRNAFWRDVDWKKQLSWIMKRRHFNREWLTLLLLHQRCKKYIRTCLLFSQIKGGEKLWDGTLSNQWASRGKPYQHFISCEYSYREVKNQLMLSNLRIFIKISVRAVGESIGLILAASECWSISWPSAAAEGNQRRILLQTCFAVFRPV